MSKVRDGGTFEKQHPRLWIDKEGRVTRVGELRDRKLVKDWNDPVRVARRQKLFVGFAFLLGVVVFAAVLATCVGGKIL